MILKPTSLQMLISGRDRALVDDLLARNEEQWAVRPAVLKNLRARGSPPPTRAKLHLLEPDLKEGRGGCEMCSHHWAARAGVEVPTHDHDRLADAYRVLLKPASSYTELVPNAAIFCY